MSQRFLRVKAKMQKEIDSQSSHTPESWADIMLRNSALLTTDEDQESFLKWILNPTDSFDVAEPTFKTIDPTQPIIIPKTQVCTVIDEEDEKQCEREVELDVEEHQNGLTSYILVKPKECKSSPLLVNQDHEC